MILLRESGKRQGGSTRHAVSDSELPCCCSSTPPTAILEDGNADRATLHLNPLFRTLISASLFLARFMSHTIDYRLSALRTLTRVPDYTVPCASLPMTSHPSSISHIVHQYSGAWIAMASLILAHAVPLMANHGATHLASLRLFSRLFVAPHAASYVRIADCPIPSSTLR